MRMDDLSSDWWEKYKYFYLVKEQVDRFILGLFLAVLIDGKLQVYLYSGFVQFFQNQYYWISTKHSIKNIINVFNLEGVKIESFRWIDRCEIEGAKSIPVSNHNLQYHFSENFDIGYILLNDFDLRALKNNKRFIFITRKVWFNSDEIIPDGYCAIGFPQEFGNLSQPIKVTESLGQYVYTSNLSYIPLEHIPFEQIENQDITLTNIIITDSDAFYARILSDPDVSDYLPRSIVGLSGGPIIAFLRNPKIKDITVYLVGIQISWFPEQRIIKAEPITRIASFLEGEN